MQANDWFEGAKALLPEAVKMRRQIHQHPELGLHLPMTTKTVRDSLQGLDVTIDEGPSTSGLVVTLRGPEQGRTILLRGDMDALPMPEDTGLSFASKEEGRMHACGHDSHTAMLAMALRLLHANRDKLAGTVKFMFQTGEEGHFGAKHMLADGLIHKGRVPDAAFAIHITPNQPRGVLGGRIGAAMASTDEFIIKVRGHGGHASMPHFALDPVPVAAEIVLALNAFVTRRINAFDPVVLTVAKITAGSTFNVIPEDVTMVGTIRAVSEGSRKKAREGLHQVASGIAAAHGAVADIEYIEGYPVTVNDAQMTNLAARTATDLFGKGGWLTMDSPVMGAEDWSYVLQQIPGCMVFLGVAPVGCDHGHAAPCHSNKMMLDEDAMAHGIAMHAAIAATYLEKGFGA